MDFTHNALCKLAVDWLQRPHSRRGPGCILALSETVSGETGESPDAIGWRPYRYIGGATLVEVKVSRVDFVADRNKPYRANPALGMGLYRYYMAPAGLLDIEDLPDRWGLIEVTLRGHIKVRRGHVLMPNTQLSQAPEFWGHTHNQAAEISLLALTLARIGDPQKYQDMLREANNRGNRLSAKCESLEAENRDLKFSEFFKKSCIVESETAEE